MYCSFTCREFRRPLAIAALALLVLMAGRLARGETVDFSDLSLGGPNSYWDGSDGSGGFSSYGVQFNNANPGWWSGWAYSNVDDTTTPGYTNQYAAYTGTGVAGAGSTYAIGYQADPAWGGAIPTITIPNGMQIQSAKISNATYVALAMSDGYYNARPFHDGDSFLLAITGEDANGNAVGSVPYYLAQGTAIVSDWESVDLRSLVGAKTLEFTMSSTDNDPVYGMNTPAYFALGSLDLAPVPEPSTLVLLLAAGLGGAVLVRRQRSAGHA
jgi:large repetitive protein